MEFNLKDVLLREICEQVASAFSGDNHSLPPQDNLLSQIAGKLELLFTRGIPSDSFYKDLKAQGGSSTMCGRVFDRGDYFYTCVECRTDPTCVFCKDCFFASAHTKHDYKMFASGGAGCCDCGDTEAWTKDPHCDKHKPQAATSTQSDPLASLPDWLMQHAHEFCIFIFEYALTFQNYTDWQSLPPHYQMKLEESFLKQDSHCLMVLNDESKKSYHAKKNFRVKASHYQINGKLLKVNSFDRVVDLFTNALGIDNRDSLTVTYAIDKVGRGLVFQGSEQDCLQKQIPISILRSKVLPIIIAQHQQCSVFLLNTLITICTQTPGLQKLCGMVLFSTEFAPANGTTILDYIFSNFPNLWISASEAWTAIFLQIVVPQEEIRKIFADCYLRHYTEILDQYVDSSTKEHCSLHFMSVQLFTSPSLALFLIECSQVLLVIIRVLEEVFSNKGLLNRPITSADLKGFNSRVRKLGNYASHDLGYLMRHSPSGVTMTQPVKDGFLDGLKAYVKLLRLFEGTDSVKKVIGNHILHDPQWKDVFHIQRIFQPITTSFINWLSHDRDLLLIGVGEVLNELETLSSSRDLKIVEKKGFNNYSYKTPEGVVSRISVSCHLPLTRLLSGLLSCCHLHGINIYVNSSLKEDIVKSWLFERAIRPIVFKSQVDSQLWKKNGSSVLHMITNYHSFMCNEMYYRDLFMLQLVSAGRSPHYTLFNLIEKFEISKFFNPQSSKKKSADENLFISSMTEEMMATLIAMLLERNNTNLAELNEDQVFEQNLINLLFIQEWSHADLLDALSRGNFSFDYSGQHNLDKFLPKLAKESFSSGKKRFTLKPDYYDRVCLFFYHDSKEHQSQAIIQLKSVAKPGSAVLQTLLTPPILPDFRPHLRPLLRIFEHQVFIDILYIILDRTLTEDVVLSDFTTHQALFLIALGLQEENSGRISGFTESLKSKKFLHVLSKLPSCPACVDIGPLIEWISRTILPKEEMKNLSSEANKQSLIQKESVKRGKLQQNRAMDNLKKQQAAFLQKFAIQDDDDEDQFEDALGEYESSTLTQPNAGIGIHCLSLVPETQSIDCIFCQESSTTQSSSGDGKFWVLPASCNPSSGLRKVQTSVNSLNEVDVALPLATLEFGVITKACGHCFHFSCWEQFMKSSSTTFSQLVISKNEFKCPLCYSVCNTILPLSLGLQYDTPVSKTQPFPSFDQFLTLIALINNVKYYTLDAIKLATSFSDCFEMKQKCSNSIPLYIENSKAFKVIERCREVGYPGIDPTNVDPSFLTLSLLNTINYTLQAKHNEMVSLDQNLLNDVSSHQQLVLRSLIHSSVIYQTQDSHQVRCECANKILQSLLTSSSDLNSNIFDYDAFALLINLQLSLPHLISQVGNPNHNPNVSLSLLPTLSRYVFKLLFYYRIVQIVLHLKLDSISVSHDPDGVNRDPLFRLWSLRRKALPEKERQSNFSMKVLHEEMLRFLLPFLRSCSLFYNLLFGVALPRHQTQSIEESLTISTSLEVDLLLAYLYSPSFMECLSEMFASKATDELIRTWFAVNSSSSLVYIREIQHHSLKIFPYGGLVDLPDAYFEILSEANNYNCPVTSIRAEEIVKCLVCGRCVCLFCYACQETSKHLSQSAQAIGPFTSHMMQCSNGVGVGIWVKSAHLLLLSARGSTANQSLRVAGAIHPIPYTDKFGEHDSELRKGSPLFLSPQEYKKTKQMWLQNDIPRTIEKSNEDKIFVTPSWHTF